MGPDGGSHQMVEDIALCACSNMRVLVPADFAAASCHQACCRPLPYIRWAAPRAACTMKFDSKWSREGFARGHDVTIVACGVEMTVPLPKRLRKRAFLPGHRCISIKPLDGDHPRIRSEDGCCHC
ncbi:MAG: hypothetical protein ACLT98_09460 [Eggerthellaceae bacterium]